MKDSCELIETTAQIQTIEQHKSHSDEIPLDEHVTEFDTVNPKKIISIPSQIPNVVTEVITSDETASLAPGRIVQYHASPICQPHVLPVIEEVIASESGMQTSFQVLKMEYSTKTVVDENMSIEVHEVDALGTTNAFTISPSEPLIRILPSIQPHYSIRTNEVLVNENIDQIEAVPRSFTTAKVDCATLELPSVSEEIVADKETTLVHSNVKQEYAKSIIVPLRAVEVTRVEHNEKEKDIPFTRTITNTAECNIQPKDYIETTQTFSECIPDKYYPEIVVATEVASMHLIEKNTYQSLQISASENTDEFTSPDIPSEHVAATKLTQSEPINVEQTSYMENAQPLVESAIPRLEKAAGSLVEYEGIQEGLIEPLETHSSDAGTLTYDVNFAQIDFSRQVARITDITQAIESNQTLQRPEAVQPVTANAAFTVQESYLEYEPLLQEHESELANDATPGTTTAITQFVSHRGIQGENTQFIETLNDFEDENRSQLKMASIAFENQIHLRNFNIMTHESETDLISSPIFTKARPTVSTDTNQSLVVESIDVIESEGCCNIDNYELHTPSIVSTHSLKVGIHDTPNIHESVDRFHEDLAETAHAQRVADVMNETLVSDVIVHDTISEDVRRQQTIMCLANVTVEANNALETNSPMVHESEFAVQDQHNIPKAISKTFVIDTRMQKSVIIENIELLEATGSLELSTGEKKFCTKMDSNEQSELLVTDNLILENIQQLEDIVPTLSYAVSAFREGHSVNVSETEILESEMEFNTGMSIAKHTATVTMSKNAYIYSQTEEQTELLNLNELQQDSGKSAEAKMIPINLQEKSISEIMTFEQTQPLEITESGKMLGKPILEEQKHITVTAPIVQEGSSELNEAIPIEQRIHNVGISHTFLAADVLETQCDDLNGIVQKDNLHICNAQKVDDGLETIEGYEVMPLEIVAELENDVGVSGKMANVSFEELKSVVECQANAWDIENEYERSYETNKIATETTGHFLRTVEIHQNQPLMAADVFNESITSHSCAKVWQEEHSSITSTDVIVYQTLPQNEPTLEINKGQAMCSIETSQHLFATVNEPDEHSEPFLATPCQSESNIKAAPVHNMKSAVINEIHTHECYSELVEEEAIERFSESTVEPIFQFEVEESTALYHTPDAFQKSKAAIEGTQEGIINTEIRTLEAGTNFDIDIPHTAIARQNITEEHKINERFEPSIYETVENILVTPSEKGKLVLLPNVELQSQEQNSYQDSQPIENYFEPVECQASVKLDSMEGLIQRTRNTNENVCELKTLTIKPMNAIASVETEHHALFTTESVIMEKQTSTIPAEDTRTEYGKTFVDNNVNLSIEITDINLLDSTSSLEERTEKQQKTTPKYASMHAITTKSEIIVGETLNTLSSNQIPHASIQPIMNPIYSEISVSETSAVEALEYIKIKDTIGRVETIRESVHSINTPGNKAISERHNIILIDTNRENEVSRDKGRCIDITDTNKNNLTLETMQIK